MIDEKWLGEISVSHHSFSRLFPWRHCGTVILISFTLYFSKGLYFLLEADFQSISKHLKECGSFTLLSVVVTELWRWEQACSRRVLPSPKDAHFAVLSSVVSCFFLDFQILCPLCVIGGCTTWTSSQTKWVRCVFSPCGCS